MKLKIFISWSRDSSHEIAIILRDWLQDVLQNCRPWLSSEDIEKGTGWNEAIRNALEDTNFGIICLTPENLASPFMHFEAGAISKLAATSRAYTFLWNLTQLDVKPPLGGFQHTVATSKDDVKKLLASINKQMGDDGLIESRFDSAFDRHWLELKKKIGEVKPATSTAPIRKTEEIMTETLESVRQLTKSHETLTGELRALQEQLARPQTQLPTSTRMADRGEYSTFSSRSVSSFNEGNPLAKSAPVQTGTVGVASSRSTVQDSRHVTSTASTPPTQ